MSKRRQWYHARNIRREDYPLLVRCERLNSPSFTKEGERILTYRLDFGQLRTHASSDTETSVGLLPVRYVEEMEKVRFDLTTRAYYTFERLIQYCVMGKMDVVFTGYDTMIREQLPSFADEAMFRAFWFLADYAKHYLAAKKEDLGENVANDMWKYIVPHRLNEDSDPMAYCLDMNTFAALATYTALTNAGCGYGAALHNAKCEKYCENIDFIEMSGIPDEGIPEVTPAVKEEKEKKVTKLY